MELLFEDHRDIINNQLGVFGNEISDIKKTQKNLIDKYGSSIKELEKRIFELEKIKKEINFINNRLTKFVKLYTTSVNTDTSCNQKILSLKNKVYNETTMVTKYIHTTVLYGLIVLFIIERIIQLF